MTVRANDFALRDLFEDRLPARLDEPRADFEILVAEVIEVQHHRVGLPAVSARMSLEVVDQELRSLHPKPALRLGGLLDVALLVRLIVLALVRGATRTAELSPGRNLP